MAGQNTLTFTDASWDQDVLKSDVPVLVDFWAEWCGPCRMVGPTVDAIADEYNGKLRVGKLNVDEKGGKVVGQKVGAMGKADFQALVDAHV
jgi:thioredoxin 1